MQSDVVIVMILRLCTFIDCREKITISENNYSHKVMTNIFDETIIIFRGPFHLSVVKKWHFLFRENSRGWW